jgi:AraC family transcriptional regulator of adaptative response / DNA-3-methyladenine glycosylase II
VIVKSGRPTKGNTTKTPFPKGTDAKKSEDALEAIEALVAEIRAQPGRFPDAASMATHCGFGETCVGALLRQHYHSTPEDLLRQARLAAAKQSLLAANAPPSAIARLVGYASTAQFEDDFRTFNGLTPAAWRLLRNEGRHFSVSLPEGYPFGYLRRALTRDRQSITERLEGDVYRTAIRLEEKAHGLTMTLARDRVLISLEASTRERPRVHETIAGLLGLGQNTAAFARLARRLELERLVEGRPELRIFQTPTIFDGLLWTIVGQQINLPFACLLRRRLIEKAGTPMANGLHAPPVPQTLAGLEPADLLPLQFSRQKADYVVSISRKIAEGALDLEALRGMSATRAERTLLALRGLGPWSVNYVMMRSLGLADCLPLGDTGVTSGLISLFGLQRRPDAAATRRLMARFSPFRSLATAHLWQLDRPHPDAPGGE